MLPTDMLLSSLPLVSLQTCCKIISAGLSMKKHINNGGDARDETNETNELNIYENRFYLEYFLIIKVLI